ncbi:hypothetical protein HQ590_15525 [bacterium]|nr:hypothetical protein [bacterium]
MPLFTRRRDIERVERSIVITEGKLQKAVHHVVHDYANLVSSGTMAVQGSHLGKGFDPPVNTHIDHAFLANCRKLYEFFTFKPKNGSVRAKDFLPNRPCELSNWGSWHRHMNEQLMHVTIARVENRKEWKGHQENKLFLEEFMHAWKECLRHLEEPYRSMFDSEIIKRLDSEFQGLDLGLERKRE